MSFKSKLKRERDHESEPEHESLPFTKKQLYESKIATEKGLMDIGKNKFLEETDMKTKIKIKNELLNINLIFDSYIREYITGESENAVSNQ